MAKGEGVTLRSEWRLSHRAAGIAVRGSPLAQARRGVPSTVRHFPTPRIALSLLQTLHAR